MKIKATLIACALAVASTSAFAIPITQANFSPTATVIHTDTFASGATTLIAPGGVTVTGGTNSPGVWTNPELSYIDESSSGATTITVQFSAPVEMIGAEFVTDDVPVTLSVYSTNNTLLDSLTLGPGGLSTLNGYPTGFVGLAENGNVIGHATFTTTDSQDSIYIGSIMYAVPEPASVALLALGMLGLAATRKRKQ